MIPNEVVLESIKVPKALAADMMDIPRKFNETLTDWAIRCQVLRRYQAPSSPHAVDGEKLQDHNHS